MKLTMTNFEKMRRELHKHLRSKHMSSWPNDPLAAMERRHSDLHKVKQDHPVHSREVKFG